MSRSKFFVEEKIFCRGANFFVGEGATSWTSYCKMGTFEELRSNSLLRRAYLLDKYFFVKQLIEFVEEEQIFCRGGNDLLDKLLQNGHVQFIVEVL